jgi:hypothetical protein
VTRGIRPKKAYSSRGFAREARGARGSGGLKTENRNFFPPLFQPATTAKKKKKNFFFFRVTGCPTGAKRGPDRVPNRGQMGFPIGAKRGAKRGSDGVPDVG